MMRSLLAVLVVVALCGFTVSTASAQVTVYSPVVPAPVVAPPAFVYRPPVVVPPVVAYRPVVPAPVVTYSPVVPAPVYYGPRAVVRTRFFVPGQPIRNYWRAVLP